MRRSSAALLALPLLTTACGEPFTCREQRTCTARAAGDAGPAGPPRPVTLSPASPMVSAPAATTSYGGPSEPRPEGGSRRWVALVSRDGAGTPLSVGSAAPNLSAHAGAVVFVVDTPEGGTQLRRWERTTGRSARFGSPGSSEPRIAADGRVAVFRAARTSDAGDGGTITDVRAAEPDRAETVVVSALADEPPDGPSFSPDLSASGSVVVFASTASNLVAEDRNGLADVFVRDRAGALESVTATRGADGPSTAPRVSGDGRTVVFQSGARNLTRVGASGTADGSADAAGERDGGAFAVAPSGVEIFALDRDTSQIERISTPIADGDSGTAAHGPSRSPVVSFDGRLVAFSSRSGRLVPADDNGVEDVFVHDRTLRRTFRVSVGVAGEPANGPSCHPSISGDGRYVAFESMADNLVYGDDNAASDIFVKDLVHGETRRVSLRADGSESQAGSSAPALSPDGAYVAFASRATDLLDETTPLPGGVRRIYVTELRP